MDIQKTMGPKTTLKKTGKGTGRAFLARRKAHDGNNRNAENIFATTGKLGGALAGALSAATEKSQVGGMVLTLKSGAQPRSEGMGSKEVGWQEMECVVADDWLEGAIESIHKESISPTPPRFGSQTPSQKRPTEPRPVRSTQ
jgi:hypothetical protein